MAGSAQTTTQSSLRMKWRSSVEVTDLVGPCFVPRFGACAETLFGVRPDGLNAFAAVDTAVRDCVMKERQTQTR